MQSFLCSYTNENTTQLANDMNDLVKKTEGQLLRLQDKLNEVQQSKKVEIENEIEILQHQRKK